MTESEEQLHKLIKTWNRFPAADEADFNCLVREVAEALRLGTQEEELAMVIHNEFYSHFGTQGPKGDVNDIVEDIMSWWKTKDNVQ